MVKKKKEFYFELVQMKYVGMLVKLNRILNKYQIEDHIIVPKKTKSDRNSFKKNFLRINLSNLKWIFKCWILTN
jgi:hypothetical protein